MKKILCFLTVLFVLSMAVSSCTEENIKPHTDNTGGQPSIDPLKP